ncbi:MAG: VWA domain-containing protein [Oscillospiraceae bacterium]|nr:VWA domain-containing protein [Oscillospiraceae bacterium]
MTKMKKVLSLVLAFVMTTSLFSNWDLKAFATDGEDVTLDIITGADLLETVSYNETTTITKDNVKLYQSYNPDCFGVSVAVNPGTEVTLKESKTYSNGVTLCWIIYDGTDNPELYEAANSNSGVYCIISGADIAKEFAPTATPEPTAEPTVEPTVEPTAEPTATPEPGITLDSLPQGAVLDAQAPSGDLAVINGTSLIAYKSLDNGAEGIEIAVESGTVVELITAYTFKDSDLVFYRYDYTGSNTELANAAISEYSGHVFIPASAVTITNEVSLNSYTNEEYGITVSGLIPTGLTLDVAPEDADAILAGSDALMGGDDWTYDVDLTYPGGEYKTTQGINVTFEKENVQIPVGAQYKAYHIKEDNSVEVLGPFTYDGNDIALTFNSLSPVGLSADVEFINERPFEKATFKNSTVKVYPSDKENAEPVTLTGLTSDDVFELAKNAPYGYIMSDGTTRYYIEWYLGSNLSISGILNVGSRYLVDINDIEAYVEPSVTPTPTPVPGPTEEEMEEVCEFILQAGLLKDFEAACEMVQNDGLFDYFTDEQLAEINSLKSTLEEMAENTADWTVLATEATLSGNGVKVYRNPVTRPDDYVLANILEPMDDGEEGYVEEIDFSEAAITGKYTDDNGNTYFIVDTDNWDIFEGRVPYRYIAQADVVISSQWNSINTTGVFINDTVKLYDGPTTEYEYVEITDGTSRGVLDVSYEIIHTDYTGAQEKWYWIGTPNWKDADGNSIGSSRYVKAEDVRLVSVLTDTTGVSVYGDIPDGATLSVSSVLTADTGLADGIYVIGENSLFYDVTLLDADGNETQPGAGGITVTFPESAVLASGLAVGDKYHVYHIHDGVVDMSEVKTYNGGDIRMDFANLSVAGISEVETKTNLESVYGTASDPAGFTRQIVYLDDFVTLYEHFEGDVAYAEVSGYQNTEIEIFNEITFTDADGNVSDFKLYQFSYYGETGTDIYNILNNYHFISSEDVSFTEIPEEITTAEQAMTALLATTTSEEFREIYVSLTEDVKDEFTFAQEIQLFQYRLSLLIAEAIDQPQDHEFPGVPVESFTNAAPFVTADEEVAISYSDMQAATYARMTYAVMPLADEGAAEPTYNPQSIYSNGALVLNKTATANKDGSYTIQLESYAKGSVSSSQSLTSVDITMVLDVSGSMNYCMLCGQQESHANHTGGYVEWDSTPSPTETNVYYYNYYQGDYVKAVYCDSHNNYNGGDGWYNNAHGSYNHQRQYTLYKKTEATCTFTRRIDVLEDAVQSFIDSTKAQNDQITLDADKHRIAIVQFASAVNSNDDYNDSKTIQELTTVTADNYESMKTTVENLDPAGATRIDLGMYEAEGIVTGALDEDADRKQVVIVFTDGTPTTSNGFNIPTANTALGYAENIKTLGATVYTISVANGANVNAGGTIPSFPTKNANNGNIAADFNGTFESDSVSGPNNSTEITDSDMFGLMNRFMHLMSSNNPAATSIYAGQERTEETNTEKGIKYTATGQQKLSDQSWSSYYLVPTSAADLTSIFGQISNDVSGATDVTLNGESSVVDIVTPYFDIPANATNVSAKIVECTGVTSGTPSWEADINAEALTSDKITIDSANSKLSVTGFDFAGNFISENGYTKGDTNATGDYHGAKLVITFNVTPDNFFLGGNRVQTNESGSQVQDKEGTNTYAFNFPTVDVALSDLTITWDDQHIYRTNNADIYALFRNAMVIGRDKKTEAPLADVLNGTNNAYVDFTFEIPGVGTYTLEHGSSFYQKDASGNIIYENGVPKFNGTWTPATNSAGLTPPVEEDTDYVLNWTMTSSEYPKAGGAKTYKEGTDTATVYVYNPIITFNDSEDWLGDALTHGVGVNYTANAEVWKNPTTGKLSSEVTMHGDKPTVAITCQTAAELTGNTSGTITSADDIPVQATVTITNEDDVVTTGVENTHYTVIHSTCSHPGCTYRASGEEFIVHVLSGELKVSKDVVDVNGYNGPTESFEFTVDNAANLGMKFTVYNAKGEVKQAESNLADTGKFNLADGEYAIITEMPKGAYTVTESDVYPEYTTESTGATGEITDTTQKLAAFTNTLKPTTLSLTKEVVDATKYSSFVNGKTFTFTVTINELPVGTAIAIDGSTNTFSNGGTITLTHGQTVKFTGLPVGATYSIVETKHAQFDFVTDGKASGTLTVAGNSETIQNKISVGDLTVKKQVVVPNDNIIVPTEAFDFTVKDENGDTVKNGTFQLADDGTYTIPGLTIGKYTVTETVNAKYTTTVDGVEKNAITVDVTPDGKTVEFTNTLKSVGLEITKTVEAPTGITHPDFEFAIEVPGVVNINALKYTVDGVEKQVSNGKITLAAGKTAVFTGLPAGAKVTITETENADYIPTPANRVVEVTLPNSGNGTAAFTNTLKTGSLEISKTVVAPTGMKIPSDEFTFAVDFTGAGSITGVKTKADNSTENVTVADNGTVTLKHGEKVVFTQVPIGAVTVTETNVVESKYNVNPTSKVVTGTIATDTPVKADFTNTMKEGKLTVQKIVSMPAGIAVNTSEEFEFIIDINNVAENDVIHYKVGNTNKTATVDKDGNITITLKHNETAEFDHLPVGEIAVDENLTKAQADLYTTTSTITPNSEITENGTTVAVFTNTLAAATLTIEKKVVTPFNVAVPGDTFTFKVKIAGAVPGQNFSYKKGTDDLQTVVVDKDGYVTITLQHNQSVVFENMPVGATYEVIETEHKNYTTTSTGAKGTIIADATAKAVFTNTLKTFNLTITKEVDGQLYNSGDTFVFNVVGENGITKQVEIAGEDSITIAGLPVGDYTVSEDTNWSFRYNLTGVSGAITANGGELTLDDNKTVTFTNKPKSDNKWLDAAAFAENKFADVNSGSVTEIGSDNVIINGKNEA